MIVHCRETPVATDTMYSNAYVIDDGYTCTQLFVGTKSLVSDIYSMKTDN